MIRAFVASLAALLLAACGSGSGCGSSDCADVGVSPLTVFAASSLKPAFDKVAAHLSGGLHVTFNYAGSQTLASQLVQGAQAGVFASADTARMIEVQSAGLLNGPPVLFAHNRLEIAVAKGNPKGIHSLADLARNGLVIVLADPSVPAGKYAQQALIKAGVTVKPASLELQVTAVVTKVALGEADAGIVYVSDVVTSGKVDGVPIADAQNVVADYPVAALQGPELAAGRKFIDFLLTPAGQGILKDAGFQGV